jgi:LmbE family N-acetylglucosaminyl deacetylase
MEWHERLLVISPHLDDAVLSCGTLLAAHPGAFVCTVFTAPPEKHMITDWDRQSGFADAVEAIHARKAEDIRALAILGASAIHLPFCDAQYQTPPVPETLVAAIEQTLRDVEPSSVMIPLGLFHSDHTDVANACLTLMQRFEHVRVHAYEDVPYRTMPDIVPQRLQAIRERGFAAQPVGTLGIAIDARHRRLKRAAINAYRSQLRAFGPDGQAGLHSDERYWRLRETTANRNAHSGPPRHDACSAHSTYR